MRLYNTLTRTVEEVRPLKDDLVTMYTCGPTVYRYAHLGNLRTFMLADLIRRALEFEGYRVTQIMNITDVGHMTDESSPEAIDKMLLAMEDEGLSPEAIALKYTDAVFEDAAALGIRPADRYPKATEHIPEMLALTETLVENGHAYVVDSGSVYYDVTSFPGYGKLSGNTLDNLREGHRDLESDPRKRNAADFALWKAAGPGRLMKWDSPWGEGFPGWHVECSAMSMKYLGDRFDIHTGGFGSAVPPSRGRDRPVRGRGRPSGREPVGARRPSAAGRTEDREVHRQRGARARAGGARHGPVVVPLAHVPDALPQRDGLLLGGHGGRRPPREAAAPPHGRVGAGGRGAGRGRARVRRPLPRRRGGGPGPSRRRGHRERAGRFARRAAGREVLRSWRRGTRSWAWICNGSSARPGSRTRR